MGEMFERYGISESQIVFDHLQLEKFKTSPPICFSHFLFLNKNQINILVTGGSSQMVMLSLQYQLPAVGGIHTVG